MVPQDESSASTSSIARFIAGESFGGVLLAAAALLALLVANSPLSGPYESGLSLSGHLRIGSAAAPWLELNKPLVVWVNDLWMAIFFLLVGLEIKREGVQGELATRAQVMLPAAAALGGMAVPALIYAAINLGDPVALRGWAIPSATDIAFALAVLAVLGSRVPASLKIFLTAVAIIDDLGAIVVIALFYTEQVSATMLGAAALCVLALVVLNRLGVRRVDAYLFVGALMWLAVLKSGVHATLAGVITALAIPMSDGRGGSPAQTLEHGLHPWVTYLILPVFAFCNAGVSLAGVSWASLVQPVTLGIGLGLVFGKAIGVFGAVWLLHASGLAARPAGASWLQVFGLALVCGVGFTMSLFIGGLAFEGQGAAWGTQVKLGVLCGSMVSAGLGAAVLVLAHRRRGPAGG